MIPTIKKICLVKKIQSAARLGFVSARSASNARLPHIAQRRGPPALRGCVDKAYGCRDVRRIHRHTKSACCVIEKNEKHPRGWGKGLCNTSLHAVTQYTDFVYDLVGDGRGFCGILGDLGGLAMEKVKMLLLVGVLWLSAACYMELQIPRTNPADAKFAVGQPCQQNEDCSAYTVCVQNQCAKCKTTQECGAGRLCNAGRCVADPSAEVSPPEGSSPDGSVPDGSPPEVPVVPESIVPTLPKFCAVGSSISAGCILKGTYNEDLTLTANLKWLLSGVVQIGDGQTPVTLTVAAGVQVLAVQGSNASLVINTNAKLIAEGTAAKPIVFSTTDRTPDPGAWGGLLLLGKAKQNQCDADKLTPCMATYAATKTTYGGAEDEDSSGRLRYVRIEYAGAGSIPALGLWAVGSKTSISYVQIHMSLSAGLSIRGGAVDLSYLVVSHAPTYGLRWEHGWRGKAQFGVIYQVDHNADAIIGHNNEGTPNAEPRSAPMLANFSLIGTTYALQRNGDGLSLHSGTTAKIFNLLIAPFTGICLRVADQATFDQAVQVGELTGHTLIDHSLLDPTCKTKFGGIPSATADLAAEEIFTKLHTNNRVEAVRLGSATNLLRFDFRPQVTSPALTGAASTLGDPFFQVVGYIGAMNATDTPWTQGWTNTELDG